MIKNYMTYPLKNMRITQSYNGDTSHKPHTTGTPKDYPIDDAGKDGNREAIFCPCDEMKITAIKGIGNSATNTVWLVSTSQVVTPTFTDKAFMTLTHWNDEDFKNRKVGDVFHRGDIICYEGTDGATANHIHITAGRGYSDNWTQSSTGKWVMTGDTKKPEDVFYVDRNFTTELWGGYLPWVSLPPEKVGSPVARDTSKNQLEVVVDNLIARDKPALSGTKQGYINRGIFNYDGVFVSDGYSWYKIENFYIPVTTDWVKIYPKEELIIKDPCPEKIKQLEIEIASLKKEISSLQESLPKKIFDCNETGKYLISLQVKDQLYLKR